MPASKAVRRARRLAPLPFRGQSSWTATAVPSVHSALAALAAHKARAFMTMFGIVVGVCGVLVINVLGQAQNAALAEQLAQLGTNLVSITPGAATFGPVSKGAASKPTLTDRDVQLLRQEVPYVRALTPLVSGTETLAFGDQTVGATVTGADPDVETVQSDAVRQGAFFTAADESAHLPVAVLGQTVVDQLYPNRNPLGAEVRIGDVNFRVVGVLQAKGHQGQTDLDDVAIVPFSTAQQRLFGAKVDSILIQASRTEQIPAVMAAATATLDQNHHMPVGGQADFNIQDFQQVVDAARQQTALLTRVLTIVAGVALAMGGFGVMNIMLISVTERTAEIGLRLAVGARPADVLLQFLVEALTITTVAGVIGLLLGFALSVVLRLPIHVLAEYPAIPTAGISLAAFVVVVATGVVFGFYPALRASRLDPVVALRSE
ncbi:MAG TPA: ABC transporter permease [Chloroflexota bacterium]|nr:ABC transporter permease [Chloroflexota bacterium]